ncbi:MAG: alpha/beta hydrolase [Reyranellaceae bacterium]
MASKGSRAKRKAALPLGLRAARLGFALFSAVAPGPAGRRAERMFRVPARRVRPAEEQALLLNARPLVLAFEGVELAGYEWRPERDELDLPPVLVQHGWESRASQLAPIVRALLGAGHRVVAFDAPAHGDSPGRTATVSAFADMVLAIDRRFGPFHAAIGHSVGGAAVLSAIAGGLRARRVATLAAPASLRRATHRFGVWLGLNGRAIAALQEATARANGRPLEAMEFTALKPPAEVPVLLLHDPRDVQVPAAESAAIAGVWPNVVLRHVAGVGHNGILAADSAHRLLLDFVAPRPRAAQGLALAS